MSCCSSKNNSNKKKNNNECRDELDGPATTGSTHTHTHFNGKNQAVWRQHECVVIGCSRPLCAHPGSTVLFQADDVQIKVSPQAICLIKDNVSCQSVPLRLRGREGDMQTERGKLDITWTSCTLKKKVQLQFSHLSWRASIKVNGIHSCFAL